MTHNTLLRAAFLLQQRSKNIIGVMTEGNPFMYRFDPEDIMEESGKTDLPVGVFFDEKHSHWTGYTHAQDFDSQSIFSFSVDSLQVFEIKEQFYLWEVIAFMQFQQVGSTHYVSLDRESFITATWDGKHLVDSNNNILAKGSYETIEFRWEHPIIQKKDVTFHALEMMK